MKKRNQVVVVIVLAIVGLISFRVYAAAPKPPKQEFWTPGCVASVPKSWGVFQGASVQTGLAFEDSEGTLRFLTNIPCDGSPLVALEVRRTPGNAASSGVH